MGGYMDISVRVQIMVTATRLHGLVIMRLNNYRGGTNCNQSGLRSLQRYTCGG